MEGLSTCEELEDTTRRRLAWWHSDPASGATRQESACGHSGAMVPWVRPLAHVRAAGKAGPETAPWRDNMVQSSLRGGASAKFHRGRAVLGAFLAVVGFLSAPAMGGVLPSQFSAPAWRGGAYTTYLEWDFSVAPGLAGPNVAMFNPYGPPTMSTVGGAAWGPVGVPAPLPGLAAWQLASPPVPGPSDALRVENKNVDLSFAGGPGVSIAWKLAVVQALYFGAVPEISSLSIPGQGDFTAVETGRSITPIGNGWSVLHVNHEYFTTTGMSPSAELFVFGAPAGETSLIAAISIDTQAIPAPGTAMLLGVAGVIATRRRRA